MVSYNMVLGDGSREITEIWRDGNGKWPKRITLKDAPKPTPQLLDVQQADASELKPFVRHETNAPDKKHCEEIWVPGTPSGKAFWDAYGYKFSSMAHGACPSEYNFINKKELNYAGYKGVEYLEHGIHAKKKKMPFLRSFMRGSDSAPRLLQNSRHSSPQLRRHGQQRVRCDKQRCPVHQVSNLQQEVDPNTGWACNHGTEFKDCQRRVKQGETAKLEMDDNVKTILPITFTAEGAVDQVSACYMEVPAGGFHQQTAMVLDESWWEKLQASC